MDNTYTVQFGARSITFYPLSLKSIQRFGPDLAKFAAMGQAAELDVDALNAAIKVLTASAQRGCPTITEDDVAEVIDLANINEVLDAMMGRSGLKRAAGDAGPTSPRTGGESTPASSPQPVGGGPTSTT